MEDVKEMGRGELIEKCAVCSFYSKQLIMFFFKNFYQAIKAETDGLREELEFVRTLGADLIFACGETEKPEVKKTIDEVRNRCQVLSFASEKIF